MCVGVEKKRKDVWLNILVYFHTKVGWGVCVCVCGGCWNEKERCLVKYFGIFSYKGGVEVGGEEGCWNEK